MNWNERLIAKGLLPLDRLALQASMYEDGARWCDFCSARISNKPSEGHKADCPIEAVRQQLETKESS